MYPQRRRGVRPALPVMVFCAVIMAPSAQGGAADDYAQWRKQYQQEFSNYLSEQDREFSEGLRRDWEAFKPKPPVVRDATPKPSAPPVAPPVAVPAPPAATPVPPAATPPPIAPSPVVVPPVVVPPVVKPPVVTAPPAVVSPPPVVAIPPPATPKPPAVVPVPTPVPVPAIKPGQRAVEFDWLGSPRKLGLAEGLFKPFNARVDNRAIADHFTALASTPYGDTLDALRAAREREKLNDWTALLYIATVARRVHPADINSQRLLTWFLGIKSGLDVRLGYAGNEVLVLVATKQMLYGESYLSLDGRRYFVVDPGGKSKSAGGQIYSYPSDGSVEKLHVVDMRLEQPLQPTDVRVKERALKFNYQGRDYTIMARVPVALAPAYAAFPQMDFDVYFSAAVNPVLAQSLLDGLRPLVQGRDPRDAANLLLRFVQKSLPYETDDEQFGFENYLFPEETIYYPYADCEDRSFLYAWLVRELLGLDVVGLNYPGHVATAVALPSKGGGDVVQWQGRGYTVADPTYIGADIGMSQPGMKGKPVTVIPFTPSRAL